MCWRFTLKCTVLLAVAAAVAAPSAAAVPLVAQAPDTTRPDTARRDTVLADTTRVDTLPAVSITPEQQAYLDGLRRVGRGIAQLKIGVDQSTRAQAAPDTAARRRAAGRLGGLCTSARSFMTGGRARMQALAFEDTLRLKARRLAQRVDEIITYTKTCETQARGAPAQVAGEISKRLLAYETALAEFRVAAGLASNN